MQAAQLCGDEKPAFIKDLEYDRCRMSEQKLAYLNDFIINTIDRAGGTIKMPYLSIRSV